LEFPRIRCAVCDAFANQFFRSSDASRLGVGSHRNQGVWLGVVHPSKPEERTRKESDPMAEKLRAAGLGVLLWALNVWYR
jgi:hypothetical protein